MLLIFRLVSTVFIIWVMKIQVGLMRLPIDEEVRAFRKVLFVISIFILIGNFVPIIIDSITMFVPTGRPPRVNPISIAYAFSNAFTAMASSVLIWLLYRLATRSNRR